MYNLKETFIDWPEPSFLISWITVKSTKWQSQDNCITKSPCDLFGIHVHGPTHSMEQSESLIVQC